MKRERSLLAFAIFRPLAKNKILTCPTKAGFTLVECLTVVAVIGVLTALLLSVLGKTLQSKQKIQSAANLRQLGAALTMYATDNKGAYPPMASQVRTPEGGWDPGGLGSWDSFILTYLFPGSVIKPGDQNSFYPIISVRASLFSHPGDNAVMTGEKKVRRGYAMPNGDGMLGIATWEGTEVRPSARLNAIPEPAKTILLTESAGYNDNAVGRTGLSGVSSPDVQLAKQPELNGRHGYFHYLFVDGHVQLLSALETIGTGTSSKPKGFWTLDPHD